MDTSAVTVVIVCQSIFGTEVNKKLHDKCLATDAVRILQKYDLEGIFIGKKPEDQIHYAVSKRTEITAPSFDTDRQEYARVVKDAEIKYQQYPEFRELYDAAAAELMESMKTNEKVRDEFNKGLVIHAALMRSADVIPFPPK